MEPRQNKQHPAARSGAAVNGANIDWGRLDGLREKARLASIRLGNPPCEWRPLNSAETAEIAESARRLYATPAPKAVRKSEDLIREMRDAAMGSGPQ